MPAKTSAASAICGTHVGLTNAETSTTGSPARERLFTKEILSAVLIAADSFCSPSRGPTSTTVTRAGSGMGNGTAELFEFEQRSAGLDQFSGLAVDGRDGAVGRSADGKL